MSSPDEVEFEWMKEDVQELKQQVHWLKLYLAHYIVQGVPCTCGFGGQHEPERETCSRNQAAQAIIEQIESQTL